MERSDAKGRFIRSKALSRQRETPRFRSSAQVRERVLLFWLHESAHQVAKLSRNLLREICEYLYAQQYLMCLKQREIRFFDTVRQQWLRLWDLEEDLPEYGHGYSLLCVATAQVLVCAGYCLSSTGRTVENSHAHLIVRGKVTRLPNILHCRYQHSAAYISAAKSVYLFGGVGLGFPSLTNFTKCEKLQMGASSWSLLSDLSKPRAGVNACVYLDLVYLCGGDVLGSVETFNWRSEAFSQSGVYLPMSGSCHTVMTPVQCLSISKDVTCWWQLKSKDTTRSVRHPPYKPFSLCPPQIRGDDVYLVSPYGCSRYSCVTGCLVENYECD